MGEPNPSVHDEGTGAESEARLQQVLDALSEAVCRFTPDGRLLFVNAAYCRLFGLSRDAALGVDYAPVVHPDDLDRVQAEVATMTADHPTVVIENRVCTPQGVRWTQWTNVGFFDADGRLLACQSAGRDITDRVLAEQALQRSHARARFLAEASAALGASLDVRDTLERATRVAVPFLTDVCSIRLLDEEGRFVRRAMTHVDADPAADARHGGVPSPVALQEAWEQVRGGEPVLVATAGEAHAAALGLDPEGLAFLRSQGVVSYLIVPITARGRLIGGMGCVSLAAWSGRIYDRQDLRLAQELAHRVGLAYDNARLYRELQEADRRKDEFLATLAHELRNPMAAVLTAGQVLQLADLDATTRTRAVDIIVRQSRQQARLVDDLLDVSRLTRGKITLRREPVDVPRLLVEVAELYQPNLERKRQRLVIEHPTQPLTIDADRARLEQILGNLLDNAHRYTPPGTCVTLSAERDDDHVALRVSDDGPGIPDDVLPRVFEPFTQGPRTHETPSGGLGIGLTIVRLLTDLHGGRVRLRQPPAGRGTELVVELPVG